MKKVKTSPVHLQYWCKTSLIDEMVCQKKGIDFNKELAQSLEKTTRHYFVLDKKGRFDIVDGNTFEKYFEGNTVPEMEMTEDARKGIEEFIQKVHKV